MQLRIGAPASKQHVLIAAIAAVDPSSSGWVGKQGILWIKII